MTHGHATRREVLGVGAALLGGCAAPLDPDRGDGGTAFAATGAWPMAGHDSARTHRASETAPAGGLDRTWRTYVEGRYTVPGPAVVDGAVFLGSGRAVYAMDLATGETRWRARADAFTHHFTPAITDDRVFVLARSNQGVHEGTGPPGRLLALDADSGDLDWAATLPGTTAPVLGEDGLYVGATGERGRLRAFDPDGTERWRVSGTETAAWEGLYATPAVVDGTVYVAANTAAGGVVAALDASTGDPAWARRTAGNFAVGPAVGDGTVYAADEAGVVRAFSPSGDVRWQASLDAGVRTPLAVGERAAYALADGVTVALDAATGERRWHTDTGVTRMNGLALGAEHLYVGGNHLTAVALGSGELVLDHPVDDGIGGAFGAPVVLEGGLLTGACTKDAPGEWYDNYLYALAPGNGSEPASGSGSGGGSGAGTLG